MYMVGKMYCSHTRAYSRTCADTERCGSAVGRMRGRLSSVGGVVAVHRRLTKGLPLALAWALALAASEWLCADAKATEDDDVDGDDVDDDMARPERSLRVGE